MAEVLFDLLQEAVLALGRIHRSRPAALAVVVTVLQFPVC